MHDQGVAHAEVTFHRAGHGSSWPAPARLRQPMMMAMCAAELGLGVALIATTCRFGPVSRRLPSTIVRTGTALFFLVAMAALNETRQRRPEAGCGCFGEARSDGGPLRAPACRPRPPPSPSAFLRSACRPLPPRPSSGWPCWPSSCPPNSAKSWSGSAIPSRARCAGSPVGRTLTALRSSSQWRRYAGQVSAAAPADVWREGCWRFVVYPGRRAAGEPILSPPSTCRPGGRQSEWRSSTRAPTRSSAGRNWQVCRYLGDSKLRTR
jgi:hypothetical protein